MIIISPTSIFETLIICSTLFLLINASFGAISIRERIDCLALSIENRSKASLIANKITTIEPSVHSPIIAAPMIAIVIRDSIEKFNFNRSENPSLNKLNPPIIIASINNPSVNSASSPLTT